jgi:hypothetical protein
MDVPLPVQPKIEEYNMSISAIIFIVIALVIVIGAVQGIRGQRQWSKTYPKELESAGFISVQDSEEYVKNTITMLFHQDANIINRITEIRKVQLNNNEVYFCDVDLGGKGRLPLTITDLFLLPFQVKTDDPLMIFFKTDSAEGAAYTKDIITKKYVLSDLYKPDGLVKLDFSNRPDLDPILFAYGESGSSLDRNLDSTLLHHVIRAGKYGFFILYYKNGRAALLTLERYKNHAIWKIEWTRQWQYIQELVRASGL